MKRDGDRERKQGITQCLSLDLLEREGAGEIHVVDPLLSLLRLSHGAERRGSSPAQVIGRGIW